MPQLKIKDAVFTESATGATSSVNGQYPEFAFIGRSNVGKSSLINMFCNRNKLAHTSSTPGKTQTVNRFLINNEWFLTDLPGYGYAKAPKPLRAKLTKIIWDYIDRSERLVLLFVLIDSRHELMKIDLDFLIKLGTKGVPFSIIFTKADKSGQKALEDTTESIRRKLLEYWEELPPCFVTSSLKGTGRDEVLDYIGTVLKDLKDNIK